ncbi:MAG: hypothetical protein ABIB98_00085 [bacterium]
MSNNSLRNQIQLVNQAINASINSLNLTKQLVNELERISGSNGTTMPGVGRTVTVPGIIGSYDGENMVTEKGEKFAVPQNYASKSGLVFGDTLKRIEDGGGFVFKQVQRVRRFRVQGVLVKKEGKWAVVTSEGSFKVLDRTVEHFGLKENDEVFAIIPEDNKKAPFAALDVLRKEEAVVSEEEKKSEEKKEEKKPEKSKEVPKPKEIKKEAMSKIKEDPKAKKETKRVEPEMSLSEEKAKETSPKDLNDDDLR